MIEIGNKNKIILGDGGVFVLNELVSFYETLGKNVLYIFGEKEYPLRCNSIKVSRYEWESLEEKIMSNLYQLDYIIVRSNFYSDKIMELINKKIHLPAFYVYDSKNPVKNKLSISKYDYIYQFYCDRSESQLRNVLNKNKQFNASSLSDIFNDDSYFIKNVVDDWCDSLSNIRNRWVRDKKLEDLFRKS
jgi:hypothetical protein